MNALRRAALVVAKEGLAGLVRRIAKKTWGHPASAPAPVAAQAGEDGRATEQRALEALHLEQQLLAVARHQEEQRQVEAKWALERQFDLEKVIYEQQARAFDDRTRQLGHTGLEEFYWYHTVDLGNGLVTPGDYDFRGQLPAFGFPGNMSGMRVLDVGSATGFFAFEFERRGADVTSVELPSLDDWDILSCDREGLRQRLLAFFKADTQEEAYRRHLDGPFQFCHAALKSRVKRCYSTIYELGKTPLAKTKFDFIYAGDILLHLFSPLQALDVLSELCGGTLMATIDVPFPGGATPYPLMAYMGGHSQETDSRTWWTLSSTCVEHVLKRLGFQSVSVVGSYSGIIRRNWYPFSREVILATRGKVTK